MSARPGMAYDWHDGRPPSPGRFAAGLVWFGFILAPIIDAFGRSGRSALHHWLVVAGAVTFSALYIALVLNWINEDRRLRSYSLAALQLALAVALTIGGGTVIHADLFQTGNTMAALIAQQITYIETNLQKHALYYLALILLVIGVATNLIARWIARRYSAGRG